jgi:hypothetical protein
LAPDWQRMFLKRATTGSATDTTTRLPMACSGSFLPVSLRYSCTICFVSDRLRAGKSIRSVKATASLVSTADAILCSAIRGDARYMPNRMPSVRIIQSPHRIPLPRSLIHNLRCLGSQWVTALARSRRSARNVEPAPRGVQADEVGLLVLNGTTAALPLPARVASISPIRRSSSSRQLV